jgi:hypothetical protein
VPTSAVESPITNSAGTSGAGRGGGGGGGGDGEAAAAVEAAEQRRGPETNRRRRARRGAAIPAGARWEFGAGSSEPDVEEVWWAARQAKLGRLVCRPGCWSDLVRAHFYFI